MTIPWLNRRAILRICILAVIVFLLLGVCRLLMISMPGKSWTGPLPPLTEGEAGLAKDLEQYVNHLALTVGERNVSCRYEALKQCADYLEASLSKMGYKVKRLPYEVRGKSCHNLEVEVAGSSIEEEIFVVGAHYDTVPGSPGANDNGSGVAAVLALADAFSRKAPERTVRFLLFVNEEPPCFQTEQMGSLVYARACRERGDRIQAMFSLETMGCFFDEEGTQRYPPPLGIVYPTKGNFIAFVGNMGSRSLVRKAVGSFRKQVSFPSEGGALPGILPGVGWSDHWSFWKAGYSAVMVTDTAPFRYPHYHGSGDTPDKVDFNRLARVVAGLEKVLDELIGE